MNEVSNEISDGDLDLGSEIVECDDTMDAEEGRIARFVAGGCFCQLSKGKPCHSRFSPAEIRALRDECRELTRDELDLAVMGQLRALTQRDEMTQKTRATNTPRARTSTQFRFGGHRICIKTFCFLHNMGQKRFKSIKASWKENGLRPRDRAHSSPHNRTKLSDVEQVVRFVLRYAEDNAILLPGRIPGYKRDDLQLLPSSTTKRGVWELYHQAVSADDDVKAIGYSLFCKLWTGLTPQAVVTKPMSDLCWTCQQNSTLIMRAHNRPVEEKSEVHKSNVQWHCIERLLCTTNTKHVYTQCACTCTCTCTCMYYLYTCTFTGTASG